MSITNNYRKDGVLLRQVLNVIEELALSGYEEGHAFGEIYESILKELQSAGLFLSAIMYRLKKAGGPQ